MSGAEVALVIATLIFCPYRKGHLGKKNEVTEPWRANHSVLGPRLTCRREAARQLLGGLAHLSPPLTDTTTTEATPAFAVFEGWEARTSISPRHADFEFRFLLLIH
jgi:hypothetical protein